MQDLEVYKHVEELLYKIYPSLSNYPKSEKFALCQEIKINFYKLLSHISLGNSVKSKRRTYLQEADGYLQILKVLFKLANKRKYISKGFFREIDAELTVVNKMLSAYIKSASYAFAIEKRQQEKDQAQTIQI